MARPGVKKIQIGTYVPGRLEPGMGVGEVLGYAIADMDRHPDDPSRADRVETMKRMVTENVGGSDARRLIFSAETIADMLRGVPLRHLKMFQGEFEEGGLHPVTDAL